MAKVLDGEPRHVAMIALRRFSKCETKGGISNAPFFSENRSRIREKYRNLLFLVFKKGVRKPAQSN